jgi:hypothetical protein
MTPHCATGSVRRALVASAGAGSRRSASPSCRAPARTTAASDHAGVPGSLDALAGDWFGIRERRTDRRGTIVFTIVAGEDHAHGDVLMSPQGANWS